MLNVKRGSVLTHWPFFVGLPSALSAIILAIISFLSGLGWMLDRKKHRQEVEALRADAKQKELDLSRDYVTEWRTYIAEPLQREVGELRQEVAELRHAIQAINFVFLGRDSAIPKQAWMALAAPSVDVCPHRDGCPVLDELRKQSQGD